MTTKIQGFRTPEGRVHEQSLFRCKGYEEKDSSTSSGIQAADFVSASVNAIFKKIDADSELKGTSWTPLLGLTIGRLLAEPLPTYCRVTFSNRFKKAFPQKAEYYKILHYQPSHIVE